MMFFKFNNLFSIFCISILPMFTTAQSAMIIAHRGASYIAPENTLASAKLGWEKGADAVEIDIYLTTDEKIIAFHDKTTKRTTNADYKITETPYSSLKSLDAGSWKSPEYKGEPIPLLSHIMDAIPHGKELVIEIKSGLEIMPYLKEMVYNHPKKEQTIFIAFDWEVILEAKRLFPQQPCYWLSSNKDDVMDKWMLIKKNALDGINLHHKIITQELMLNAKNDNIPILSWTINDLKTANRLIALGIAGITTDRPGWLRSQILNK